MCAQREAVLSAVMAIFETPQFAARRGHLKIQASTVEQLKCLLARSSRAYCGIGQHFGGMRSFQSDGCPQLCPHFLPGCQTCRCGHCWTLKIP